MYRSIFTSVIIWSIVYFVAYSVDSSTWAALIGFIGGTCSGVIMARQFSKSDIETKKQYA